MAKMVIKRGDGTEITADNVERTLSYLRYSISFTPVEWKIMSYLYSQCGEPVSRKTLLKLIWDSNHNIPTRTVDVHVSAIRKKLTYIKGARIDSVYGIGYRFILLHRF
jgi:DNA-binding response OmpR family regulator